MQRFIQLCIGFGYNLVHTDSLGLFRGLSYVENSDGHRLGAKGNSDLITELHVIGRLRRLAVDGDTLGITGIVCHGPALYKSGYLQIFIKTHN